MEETHFRHRHAGDGKFVNRDYAEENPLTTVTERVEPEDGELREELADAIDDLETCLETLDMVLEKLEALRTRLSS